jgi:hypothetical protein
MYYKVLAKGSKGKIVYKAVELRRRAGDRHGVL